jgi:hypothetical protein
MPLRAHDDQRAQATPDAAAPTEQRDVANVLALQRSAGNAAVAGWVGRAVLARNIPADPTGLGDYSSVRQQIHYDTDSVPLGALSQYWLGGRANARTNMAVTTRFSGAMAAPGGTGVESELRDWLHNIGTTLFNLHDAATDPARTGVTRIEQLDLTAHGGQNARYRFTVVQRAAAARGQPAQIDLLVELLGAVPAALLDWAQVPADRQTALQNRFSGFGFVRAPGWNDDQFGKVMQCLERIPDATLTTVRDATFERRPGATNTAGEAGRYEFSTPPPTRTIALYGDAFQSDNQLLFTLTHEVGHALSARPKETNRRTPERGDSPEYRRAATTDGGLRRGITEYARTDWHEHYSEAYMMFVSEPDTLQTLRPATFAYFQTLTASFAPPPAPAAAGAGATAP